MNLNIVFFTVHLALLEFVGVLSLPQRRDREHRLVTVTPSTGTLDVNMTSSRSTTANRVRQQQKQKSISVAVVGEHQPPMRNKTGRVQVTTESSTTVAASCDGQCDIHLCPVFNGTAGRCQQAAVVSDPCRCCDCNSHDVTTRLPNITNRPLGNYVRLCGRILLPDLIDPS